MVLIQRIFEFWQIFGPQQLHSFGLGLFLASNFRIVPWIVAPN
jgi:hypothetical protein